MSSQGGGKARDKRSHRNKPYERRQGLLGRLTGTVSRLLPESWVPAWLQEEEDAPLPAEPRATRRNHLNAAPDTWTGQPTVGGGVPLREDEDGRLMADAGGGPVTMSSTNLAWTARAGTEDGGPVRTARAAEDDGGPSSWQPPDRPSAGPGPGPGPGLDESMARKRRRRQLQRDDDSEMSDDSGQPDATPAVRSLNTSVTAGASRGRPQPAALSSKRPRFNASALNTSLLSQEEPASTSLNRSGAGLSPFYPGPTVYGGAASHRRLRVPPSSAGPYQVRPRAVPVRAAAGADGASMSTTARRILTVLEGMSTPVTDARRVPLTSPGRQLLDCSFDGQRRAGLYGAHGARLGRRRPEEPPVHRVVSPVTVAVEPNRSLTRAPPLPPPPAEDAVSRRVTFSSQPTPTPAAAVPATGGKMRRQKERGHYSSRSEPDPEQLPPSPEPLPDVSLPFTNIRPFSLSTSTPKPAAAADSGDFTFSRPRSVCSPGGGLVNGLDDGAELTFAFSAPTAVSEPPPVASPAAASTPGSGPAAAATSWGDRFTGGSAAVKSVPAAAAPKPAPAAPVASSWGDKFKPAAGTWTCDVCMVSNKPDASKCAACQTPGGPVDKTASSAAKPASPPVASSWGDKFKPAAGTWTCDTSNKPEAAKCVACETPSASAKAAKPAVNATLTAAEAPVVPASSWGDKFKPAAGQWTCDTCMLSNKAEAAKCAACETPNANASKAVADSSAAAKPAETWECTTCLVRNKPAVSKCAACESPRPESRAKDSTPYQFGATKPAASAFAFGFNANKTGESKSEGSGFVFGVNAAANKTIDSKAPETDGFVFGAKSKSDASKASSGSGFTFGVSADKPPAAAAFAFGFGSGAAAADGASPKTSESTKAPTLNFNAGSVGSPGSLKRKQSSVDRPAEKTAAELKTGNVMDLLGGGSASVTKPAASAAADVSSADQEAKTANKATVLPANGGFSFGAATSGAAATGSANFTFGVDSQSSGGASQNAATKGFSFGEPAAKKPTELAKSDAQDSADKPPALFSFGSRSSGAADKPSSGSQVGSGALVTSSSSADGGAGTKATSAASTQDGGLAFVAKTSEQSDKSAAGFSFGAKTSESSTQPTGVFAFGTNAKPSDSTGKPSSGFSFGAKASESSDKPSATFSFGSGSAAKPDKPADFSFGAKTSGNSDKPAGLFSFGSGSAPAAKSTGVFAFGSTPSEGSSSTPSSGGFSFGTASSGAASSADRPAFGAPAATKADTAPVFAIGATTNGPAAKKAAGDDKPAPAVFQFGAGSAAPAAAPFGTSASAPAPFAFGAKTTTPATFNFGGSSVAPATTSAPFAFGGQPAAAPAPGVFAFGQGGSQPAAAATPPAFGQSAAPAAPSAGFSFGVSSTPSFNFSGGGQQAAAAAAPAAGGVFRFGAPSAGAPPAATAAAAAAAPAPAPFGAAPAQPPGAANPFSATASTIAGRKIRTAKRRTVKK